MDFVSFQIHQNRMDFLLGSMDERQDCPDLPNLPLFLLKSRTLSFLVLKFHFAFGYFDLDQMHQTSHQLVGQLGLLLLAESKQVLKEHQISQGLHQRFVLVVLVQLYWQIVVVFEQLVEGQQVVEKNRQTLAMHHHRLRSVLVVMMLLEFPMGFELPLGWIVVRVVVHLEIIITTMI